MIKKILVLVAMTGMVFIDHSTLAQTRATKPRINRGTTSNSQSTRALKPAPAKATRLDPLQYEFITGSFLSGPRSYIRTSVVNCRNKGDEYVQIEIHTAAVPTQQVQTPQAGSFGASYEHAYSAKLHLSATLLRRSNLTKVPPNGAFVFWHIGDRDGSDTGLYWVKIKTSSECLIPSITNSSFAQDRTYPERVDSYTPGDFAVYTRDPFKRIR
jgi:hypothetical protein